MKMSAIRRAAAARGEGSLRLRLWCQLNPEGRVSGLARVLIVAILAATALAVLETEPEIAAGRELWFARVELGFALIFSAEYAARWWTAPEGGVSRLRWMLSPTAIIDLLAILASLLPFVGANAMLLRLLRVVRMLRLAKLGHFSSAFTILERAVKSRLSHLGVALILSLFFLIVGATLMYMAEAAAQPDKFGSIPRALWWTAVTMTTVGYGDVVPLTPLGKVLAGLVSLGGIALIAIPTGIMASAFSDHMAEEERARAAAEAALAAELAAEAAARTSVAAAARAEGV